MVLQSESLEPRTQ